MPKGIKTSFKKQQYRVLDERFNACIKKKCGTKEYIMPMPEHANKLTGLMMEKLEPFILHQFTQSRKREQLIISFYKTTNTLG